MTNEVVLFGTRSAALYRMCASHKKRAEMVNCVPRGNKALVCFGEGNNIHSAVMSTQCVQQCKIENQTEVEQDQDHD